MIPYQRAKIKQQEEEKNDAWINVDALSREIHPVVGVRLLNSSGEDIATRRRTQQFKVSSSALEWNFQETLTLPIQKSGRNNLTLVFDIITGDHYEKPIASIKMKCNKAIGITSKSKTDSNAIREVLLWNHKRTLRRRFALSKSDAPDAPPAVFYAGELIVSIEYVKGSSFSASSDISSSLSKTNVVPIVKNDQPYQQMDSSEERDRFVVTIKKIKALGDDGTSSKSSARVWGALLALFVYFTVGVVVYVYGEGYSFVDSLWFCVATITTVGFGDVKPKTQSGKLFTAFYALVGYVLVGVAVGMITAYVVDRQAMKRKLMIQKAQALALGGEEENNEMVDVDHEDLDLSKIGTESHGKKSKQSKKSKKQEEEANALLLEKTIKRKKKEACRTAAIEWIMTIVPVVLVVALGMVVMVSVEGVTAIDSFYWAMATGTTVGYGDIAPRQASTRLFGCFYVFLVVAVTARIVGKISDVFLSGDDERDVQAILGKKPDAAWLRSLDVDGSGDVTAIEYLSAMLVRLQYVEEDKIELIMKAFHKLDSDDSGTLSIEDLVSDMDKQIEDEDEEEDENEDNIVRNTGGRFSFTGPVGESLVLKVQRNTKTETKEDAKEPRGANSNKNGGEMVDILEEAEALISIGPETDSLSTIESTAIQPQQTTPLPPPRPPLQPKTESSGLKKITGPDNSDAGEGDVRHETDLIEEATEVLKSLGTDLTQVTPVQAIADEADQDGAILCHCTAMYDFEGQNDGELGFKRGDVLNVTELDNSDGWWHGSDKNMNWGAFPYGYVYCNMEREGAAYLLLPKDWAVHESTGNKSKLGTFSYETKILTTITNEEKDWSGAKLL